MLLLAVAHTSCVGRILRRLHAAGYLNGNQDNTIENLRSLQEVTVVISIVPYIAIVHAPDHLQLHRETTKHTHLYTVLPASTTVAIPSKAMKKFNLNVILKHFY